MADQDEGEHGWPRYCPEHNYLLDKDGRCSLCAMTNIDPKRVKRGGDHDRLPNTGTEAEGDPPSGGRDDNDDDTDIDDEAWRSRR